MGFGFVVARFGLLLREIAADIRSPGVDAWADGSPHWTISATGSSVRLPDVAVLLTDIRLAFIAKMRIVRVLRLRTFKTSGVGKARTRIASRAMRC
jgi:hypothetical protein